jgi:rRNA maturation endonuclease Nob1
MTSFEVICSACMAKVKPVETLEQEICPICGHQVDEVV